jgi:hypothetical protein
MLAAARLHIDGQRKRRKGVGSAIRRSIPVRTFADWRDPPPGFFEINIDASPLQPARTRAMDGTGPPERGSTPSGAAGPGSPRPSIAFDRQCGVQ